MPRNPFTQEEDNKLRYLVERIYTNNKDINWNFIAFNMETKNARQCKDRWLFYLQKGLNKEEFSNEENYLLLKRIEEMGHKWKNTSKFFNNRTEISLKSQYRRLIRHGVNLDNVLNFDLKRKKIKSAEEEKKDNITVQEDFKEVFDASVPMDDFDFIDIVQNDDFTEFY